MNYEMNCITLHRWREMYCNVLYSKRPEYTGECQSCFHMKGFALGLALKQRRNATRKSPKIDISLQIGNFWVGQVVTYLVPGQMRCLYQNAKGLCIASHRALVSDWKKKYGTLTDMVVPESSRYMYVTLVSMWCVEPRFPISAQYSIVVYVFLSPRVCLCLCMVGWLVLAASTENQPTLGTQSKSRPET